MPRPAPVKQSEEIKIVSLFLDGKSVLELSRIFNASRTFINKLLQRHGIQPRNSQEANRLSSKQRTPEQKRLYTQAARQALKGYKYTFEEKCRRALFREQNAITSYCGPFEKFFAHIFKLENIKFIAQKAIGPYNVDFLVNETVAVEITRARARYQGIMAESRERIIQILKRYPVFLITVTDRDSLMYNLDKLISDLKVFCLDPSSQGKIRMIRCSSQDCIVSRSPDTGQFTTIKTPKKFLYSTETIDFNI